MDNSLENLKSSTYVYYATQQTVYKTEEKIPKNLWLMSTYTMLAGTVGCSSDKKFKQTEVADRPTTG
jgi:hypothetical protein